MMWIAKVFVPFFPTRMHDADGTKVQNIKEQDKELLMHRQDPFARWIINPSGQRGFQMSCYVFTREKGPMKGQKKQYSIKGKPDCLWTSRNLSKVCFGAFSCLKLATSRLSKFQTS